MANAALPSSVKTLGAINPALQSGESYIWPLKPEDLNNREEMTLILRNFKEKSVHFAGSEYEGMPGPRLVLQLSEQAKNRPPIARISRSLKWQVSDSDGDQQEEVVLDGRASQDPDGSQLHYFWYDNGTYIGDQAQLRASLGLGKHQIALKVIDQEGARGLDSAEVRVLGISSAFAIIPVNNWEEEARPSKEVFDIYPNPSSGILHIRLEKSR
ncbi:MAG: hypothetical protein AAFU64_05100, partial [Bacteroidota bacterium]